jgi:hypothetical protein
MPALRESMKAPRSILDRTAKETGARFFSALVENRDES